ncbi:MAG: hypothetical protein COA43_10460 [Robiginitomaculum sp.]|nr:MAG: hypothetical protein COA43_10460 [Robiginitomaculum sp.]
MSDDDQHTPEYDEEKEREILVRELKDLRVEHRHLDLEITALRETGALDMINIARMKKLKLRLKDKITKLNSNLTPDIIA